MFEQAPTPRRTLSPGRTFWQKYALWLVSLLLAGCTVIPTAPTLPTPVRPPEIESTADALQAALDGEFPLGAITIRYEVGNPAWEGRTTLTVDGSGLVQVTFERSATGGEQHSTWQSRLAEAELYKKAEMLLSEEEAAYAPIYYYSAVSVNKPWVNRTFQKLAGQHWDKWTIDWEAKKAATK